MENNIDINSHLQSEPNYNKLVFFDTETVGFKPPYIISMALVCYENGKRIASKYEICNPDWDIPEAVSKVNGFTNENVQGYGEFPDIWGEVMYYFEDSIWVAHHVNFDEKSLSLTLKRYDIPIPKHWTCDTLENAKKWIPKIEVKNYKLGTLCEYFGIELKDWHSANADTLACLRIYNKLIGVSQGNMIIHDEVLY